MTTTLNISCSENTMVLSARRGVSVSMYFLVIQGDRLYIIYRSTIPITYWHDSRIYSYSIKSLTDYTYIDDSARPVSGSGITRSETNDNRIKYLIPYAKTVTLQSSYFIRACKTWNILSDNLRDRNIGFYAFKSGLKLYYKNALSNTYI
jgi:hypothetical protein